MNFEDLFVQVFQPYFYYSIILLTILFISIKIAVKCFPFMSSKTKSLIYLIPLAAPLFVMLYFPPKILLQAVTYHLIGSFSVPQAPALFSPFHLIQPPSQTLFTLVSFSISQIPSITGIICLTGLAFAGIYAFTSVALGDWLACRLLHVINLGSNEYEWLQTEISAISRKLGVAAPKVGLVEDLRPNAFTMGHGSRTRLVFTIGLLNILEKEEILAVASHELAHVKNHDFLFKTFSNALTTVSFFNPLAFFALFNSQREREMLADENGAKLLQKPDSLATALTKITKALQNLPGEARLTRLTSNLLVTSPIIHRPQILSGHPKIDLRLRNINRLTAPKPKAPKNSKLIAAVLLTCVIIVAGVACTYALADLQSRYATPKTVLAYVKGASADSTGNYLVLVNSNLTGNLTAGQIISLQRLNPQIISASNLAQLNASPTLNQNHAEYRTPQPNLPNQITIVYTLTNENNATFVIKF